VIKIASRNKEIYNYLLVNYFDKGSAEMDLYQETKKEIDNLCSKSYKAYSPELKLKKMLEGCRKCIAEFGKNCKTKNLEIDLIMYVLEIPFQHTEAELGTCFTEYDTQVGMLVRRAVTLLSGIHEDYIMEYKKDIDNYLNVLHQKSNHVNLIYSLPKEIEGSAFTSKYRCLYKLIRSCKKNARWQRNFEDASSF